MNEAGYIRAVVAASVLPGLNWGVRVSGRRSTIGLTVEPDGGVTIAVPQGCAPEEVIRTLQGKLPWIVRTTRRQEEIAADHPTKEIVNGENFPYLGRSRQLTLVEAQQEAIRLVGDRFLAAEGPPKRVAEALIEWYQQAGSEWMAERAPHLARRLGVDVGSMTVCDLDRKWGVRRPDGEIALHWALFQMPTRLADLVAVHELAHIAEPRHGPEFLRLVAQVLPDHRERSEELARFGRTVWIGAIG
ncbi:SprT family zinc-dependent metalloprotease [Nocardia sp. NPDC005745]|uniref:M48 family metallopeptidase n=1 Tax=Nocardia sp. NPDC005745 TaxID=3157061 RepID=UPI0033E4059E